MIYLRLLRSIAYTLLCLHLLHILVHKLFTCLPNSLSGCLNLQRNTFSPSHYHLFLKHIDTVAIFVPLLPCLPDHCLNSVSDSLSLNFAPDIHLIILISALCNAWWLVWNNGGWGLENMEKSQFASGQGKVKEMSSVCVCVYVCVCVCVYVCVCVRMCVVIESSQWRGSDRRAARHCHVTRHHDHHAVIQRRAYAGTFQLGVSVSVWSAGAEGWTRVSVCAVSSLYNKERQ